MPVKDQLDRLAAFEPAAYPVVSLYLNSQPGQTGRDQFHDASFARRSPRAARTYRDRLAGDASRSTGICERIARFLETSWSRPRTGVAVFACSAGELFEAVQLTAPIDQHWLYIGDRPHLYPLARIESLLSAICRGCWRKPTAPASSCSRPARSWPSEEVKGVKTQAHVAGRMVAGAIPAPHRELPRPAREGSRRRARQDRASENIDADHRRRRRGDHPAAARADAEAPRREDRRPHAVRPPTRRWTNASRASLEAMRRVRSQTEREKVEAGGRRVSAPAALASSGPRTRSTR